MIKFKLIFWSKIVSSTFAETDLNCSDKVIVSISSNISLTLLIEYGSPFNFFKN